MITKPTLFILGAGASMPYGFPDARTLYDDICAGSFDIPPESDDELPSFAESRLNDKRDFCDALSGCGLSSVDRFLQFRQDLAPIRKAAIAGRLIKYERPIGLFKCDRSADWYRKLFTAMVTSLDQFEANKVAFATFNYDRSLEHFLTTSLSNVHNVPFEAARDAVGQLRFEHLYGSLGDYFEITRRYRAYSVDERAFLLRRAASSIRISSHETLESGVFDALEELYEWASTIVVLGVGFTDHENTRRLGLDRIAADKPVLATRLGLTDHECKTALAVAGRRITWAGPRDDCLMLIRNRLDL